MKKIKHKKHRILLPVLFVAGILLITYLAVAMYFMNHFYFHTTINGEDATGCSVSEVKKKIADEVGGYVLSLQERNNVTETIKGKDIDLNATFDDSIDQLLEKQNSLLWLGALVQKHTYTIEKIIKYDETKLNAQISALKCMDAASVTAPVNATVSPYSQNDGYTIIPEENGNTIDTVNFTKTIAESLENLKSKVSLEKKNCYVKPTVTKDTQGLKTAVDTLNKYAKTQVTYDFGDNKVVLNGTVIKDWLIVNDDFQVKISEGKIKDFVMNLAKQYNTAGKSKNFTASDGTAVTITGGNYGWKINQGTECKQIMADIQNATVEEREPAYTQKANSHGANDYGNTYVDVNLTAQHLNFYKDGKLVIGTDFVSGSIKENDATPTGAYFVNSKETDRFLTGADYKSHVDYWMPFNGDVGLHDASWRSTFGGSIYLRKGSHGCVNLPAGVAKTIYENIDVGDAVLVYQTAPTPIVADPATVVAEINTIGPVTVQSQTIMTQIRTQYNSLSDADKALVSNYGVLVADEAALTALLTQPAVPAQ